METVSVKVPNDIKEMLKEYCEENEISQSEAVRRLLLDGLRSSDDQDLINDLQKLRDSVVHLHDEDRNAIDQRLEAIEASLRTLEEKINNE